MYTENCKALMKETAECTNKWKAILCSYIGNNVVKLSILPKMFYRVNAIPLQISIAFFYRNRKKLS